MSEKPRQTRTREQDKDEDKDEEETGALLKELKVIQSKMDNISTQYSTVRCMDCMDHWKKS